MRKCVDSVIGQTYQDIEIILVDDGSLDGSEILCDVYAEQDSRIYVVHKKNKGLSAARNTGIEKATGDFLMFLDGDDYLREDAVECCLKAMQEYPCDFVQFLYQEVEDGQEPVLRQSKETVYQATSSKELFKNLYRLGGVAASGATKFMHRELALDIPFEDIRHEDEMWCTKAFQRNLTATYLPEELYYYVMRKGSIIHSKFNKRKLDRFAVSECRINTLNNLGYAELLNREYASIFQSVLNFYVEAREASDDESIREIRRVYIKYQKEISKSNALSFKFMFLSKLMRINFIFVKLYVWYWVYVK